MIQTQDSPRTYPSLHSFVHIGDTFYIPVEGVSYNVHVPAPPSYYITTSFIQYAVAGLQSLNPEA